MNRHRLHWTITEREKGMLIREFLLQKAFLSNRLLIKAKQAEGAILVNDVKKTVRYQLEAGDELTVIFPPEEVSAYLKAENKPIDIVYEDDALLIVNKPANLPTMPSRTHPSGTLANRIIAYYQKHHLPFTVHVVTRLDKDTSGLVLIAKHQHSHSFLSSMQRNNQIMRFYEAIVHGQMEQVKDVIDAPIGRHPDSIIERVVTESGQEARTFYQVKKKDEYKTFVHVQLETGRTHQIRVHFSHLGHPLLGDTLYGGKQHEIGRQALHCNEIRFTHPFTNEALHFTVPIARDMQLVLFDSQNK